LRDNGLSQSWFRKLAQIVGSACVGEHRPKFL
jgi:hypothetical protein